MGSASLKNGSSRRPHPIFAKTDLENPRPVPSKFSVIIPGFSFLEFIQPSVSGMSNLRYSVSGPDDTKNSEEP
jgi:hypothetical protein